MDINMLSIEDVREITRAVVAVLLEKKLDETSIPVGVSNRHVYLNRDDMDILFGEGSELNVKKMLKQPGQYVAEECITIRGKKGRFDEVSVFGPLRSRTQIEISISDGLVLGVTPPIRESGQLDGTPGIELIGPCGTIRKSSGVIAALRNIHMTPGDAKRFGVNNGQIVKVEICGPRGAVFNNVLIRVSDKYVLEMHIDMDEANAVGAVNGTRAVISAD